MGTKTWRELNSEEEEETRETSHELFFMTRDIDPLGLKKERKWQAGHETIQEMS